MPTDRPGSPDSDVNPAAEETRLIAGAKHGDHASFEKLVERYMTKAIAVATGYVGNRHDALDLAQEAFYRVYRSLHTFRDGEPFAPWFFRILRNACLTFLQRRKRRRAVPLRRAARHEEEDFELPVPDDAPSPLQQAEASEAHRLLWKAIEDLSLPHREIVLLRHFEELDYASIARVLDVPIGTVMSRLYHARRKLRAAVERRMNAKGAS